ncbi:flagellar biosynthetic protein FliO [Salinarimonas ramus]|uniref:Flagellar biosynthesis protein, FliO n=1 Tax=Salinarimonas ramus TaxID=690164 RepID=A0A917V4S6_9HYPH|nr:flagellar biosynthetic protein FliO [Salinarimonas ramus]GGK37307.1 hypothetical protein GCM10011322_25460 [Salinarimonas ramus]
MLGFENTSIVQYLIAFAVVMGLLALFAWLAPRLLGRRIGGQNLSSGKNRQPRLGIVDVYDLDRQRQLVLLRRDGVEHLLLIGGPNDVVVESGIGRAPPRPAQRPGGAQAPMPAAVPPVAAAPASMPFAPPPPEPARDLGVQAAVGAAAAGVAAVSVATPSFAPSPEEARDPAGVSDAALAARAPDTVAPEAPAPETVLPKQQEPTFQEPVLPEPARPEPIAAPRVEPRPFPRAGEPQAVPAPAAPAVPPARRGLMDLARAAAGGAPVMPQRSRATPTVPPQEPAPAPRREPVFDASPAQAPLPEADVPPPSVETQASRGDDAGALSDVARQLEEALRRPLPHGATPRRPAESEPTVSLARPAPRPAPARETASEFDFASLLRRPATAPAARQAPPVVPPVAAPPPAEMPRAVEEPAPRVEIERAAADDALARFGVEEPQHDEAPVRDEPTMRDEPPASVTAPVEEVVVDETTSEETTIEEPAIEETTAREPAADEPPRFSMDPEEEIAATPEASPPEELPATVAEAEAPDAEPEPHLVDEAERDFEPERFPEAETTDLETTTPEPVATVVPVEPESAAEAPAEPEPEPLPASAAIEEPAPAAAPEEPARPRAIDPFSVEEIEAEFARLLGRAPSRDEKS